jgi:hypothetical protein
MGVGTRVCWSRGRWGRDTYFSCGLGVHHEQLGVIEEGDGLLAALNAGEVLFLDAVRVGKAGCQ